MAFIPAAIGAIGSAISGAVGSIFSGGLGSVLGAAGSIVSGVAGMAAANYQAKVARMNAEISRDNAQRSIQEAQLRQIEQDNQTRALMGEQLAAQSASGLSLGGRSQMLTRKSAAQLGRKDALNVRYQGEVESTNYENQARGHEASAQMYKSQGINSLIGGFFDAGSSIIGGAKPSRKFASTANPVSRPVGLYA